jgi:hypothetical protein
MIVLLDIYDNSACRNTYLNDRKLKDGIKDSQLCAGVLNGGKDTCQVYECYFPVKLLLLI